MRVTSSMYYESLYGSNNSKLNEKLFDVNKQIASGLKIQYASDDIATFTETMRLDNEITTLGQVKQSTESGYKISNQSDVILNDFEDSMNRFRTLLIQASNDTNSETSRDAISLELRGLEKHLKNLSNTSINGQYLFSGSMVDVKPISDDGTYNGNDVSMNSFLGSNSQQQYNLTGADLFLGEEIIVQREVTANVKQVLNNPPLGSADIDGNTTMLEFMGDSPDDTHHFYLRGVQNNGTAFTKQIPMFDTSTMDDLLLEIGYAYGNTGSLDLVNVSLNSNGQIIVEDKLKGSSKLDFHLVGATDFTGTGMADIATGTNTIDDLFAGTTDYITATTTPELYIKEFINSGLTSATGIAGTEGLIYDRTEFTKDGSILSSSTPQILKSYNTSIDPHTQLEKNAFASPSSKISDVADLQTEILPSTNPATYTLNGTTLKLEGLMTDGITPYDIEINFNNSTLFTYNGTPNYEIFNMENPRAATPADSMTYQQLMDVVNMAVTGNLPVAPFADADEYDTLIKTSNFSGTTSLSYDGKIQFNDLSNSSTKATIALYDSKSGDFSTTAGSVMSFNSNNALTIRDPKTDFFQTIDEMITAVENYKNYPDSSSGDMRNIGIQNAISMMDDLQDHVFRSHSVVGAQSNTLTNSLERTELLEISTMTLRSSVIDTDLAEASLELTQLTLNYEAMLSTVGRVSKLSLVNYL
ncbi:MAG: flagellar biosynthesis protein FlgL [Epsilonproteobacteria bacterium]|nr:MAG: flagellar biosynthesis protein FlgL [Campylobacterota bacterium]